jgi:hypothetical protein
MFSFTGRCNENRRLLPPQVALAPLLAAEASAVNRFVAFVAPACLACNENIEPPTATERSKHQGNEDNKGLSLRNQASRDPIAALLVALPYLSFSPVCGPLPLRHDRHSEGVQTRRLLSLVADCELDRI